MFQEFTPEQPRRSLLGRPTRGARLPRRAKLSNATHAIRFSLFPLPPVRPVPARDFIEQIDAKFASCPRAPWIAFYKDCSVSSLSQICAPCFKSTRTTCIKLDLKEEHEDLRDCKRALVGRKDAIGEFAAIVKRLRVSL